MLRRHPLCVLPGLLLYDAQGCEDRLLHRPTRRSRHLLPLLGAHAPRQPTPTRAAICVNNSASAIMANETDGCALLPYPTVPLPVLLSRGRVVAIEPMLL